MQEEKYKLIAPDVNRLISCYSHEIQNPEQPSATLVEAMDPLFIAMEDLAPSRENDEAKGIWVTVPRGEITDWSTYKEARDYDGVKSKKEYMELWQDYYPFEMEWYYVRIIENKPDSSWKFRGLSVVSRRERCLIVNADLKNGVREETWYKEEPAIELCKLLLPAVKHSMEMLRDGTYNVFVSENLPYPHRTGVVKRSVVYVAEPEYKDRVFEGLKPEQIQQYRNLIISGANDELKIGRLEKMTANDFFRACELGYKAIGKMTEGFTPVQLYRRYSDGRDEGLTGEGHGLNEGPGIDFDDPAAWEEWYFGSRGGGHPWEIVPGGNSTHMDLFVRHDKNTLDWKVRFGEMTQEEADQHPFGFYYLITGKHRPMESVNFYLALHDAGLPVLISDAEEILARFDASDYIGIVPHSMIPKYCESMFPKEYGRVIDFMHVYEEDLEKYKDDIIWLPEDPAELRKN